MKWLVPPLIVIGFLVLIALGAMQLCSAITTVERGEGLPNVPWLPKAASDVSFARTYNWQYYEFDISEPEFVRWASRWELSEIDEPFFVTRFSVLDSPGALYDGPRDVLERRSGSLIPENLPGYTAQITEGLCYHHYDEKRHGGVYVAFDRGTSRAYFHSTAR